MTRPRDIPRKYRKLYERAMSGRHPRDAIRFQCIECMGYQEGLVEGCTDPHCALYPYRMSRDSSYRARIRSSDAERRKNGAESMQAVPA